MKFSLKHYVRYLRKQKEHVQHTHALILAGVITALLAAIVLYVQYGFWHTTYDREADTIVGEPKKEEVFESPKDMMRRLFSEGKTRFQESVGTINPLTGEGETFDRNASGTLK